MEENEITETEEIEVKKDRKGFFSRLVSGLGKTREKFVSGFDSIFTSHEKIDDDFYDELEETMVTGDIGIETADALLDELRDTVSEEHIKDPKECRKILIEKISDRMKVKDDAYDFENKKSVILLVGVNGTGKTTSAGKLSYIFREEGKKVLLAAADTFRAAACDQLKEWSKRAGVDIIMGQEGADPASVVYDAAQAAKARNTDILICDTAGRLHNKKNLMDELAKTYRILKKEYPEAHLETLLVLDGTTGQNALAQAQVFSKDCDVTGIILTKLDGTAKGGIAIAIQSQLKVPVKYIGVGEKIDDLQKFNSEDFVNALFGSEPDGEEQL